MSKVNVVTVNAIDRADVAKLKIAIGVHLCDASNKGTQPRNLRVKLSHRRGCHDPLVARHLGCRTREHGQSERHTNGLRVGNAEGLKRFLARY